MFGNLGTLSPLQCAENTYRVVLFFTKNNTPLQVSVAYLEIIAEISWQLKAVNYFCKEAPSWMFDWVLNTPLGIFDVK